MVILINKAAYVSKQAVQYNMEYCTVHYIQNLGSVVWL